MSTRVSIEQTTLPVIEICELANSVMEDFRNRKLDIGKPEHQSVVSQVLGNFIGRVIERGMQLQWSNGKHEHSPAIPTLPIERELSPVQNRFHCPSKKRFAKLSASGKCSACGRHHAAATTGNGNHAA